MFCEGRTVEESLEEVSSWEFITTLCHAERMTILARVSRTPFQAGGT